MTIHNINESKFLANQQQTSISNHVEITRIPSEKNCDKLAVGCERKSLQQHPMAGGLANGGGPSQNQNQNHHHPESVFEPNQINLNELTSDEREIESFKRFNYFFDPPKNKMKVNLNVQDIYNNARKQDSPSQMTSTHLE